MKYISSTHRCAKSYRAAKLEGEGLGSCQHVYIFQICRHPGISQEQLSRRISVNKSNVTRQLSSLEQGGFITREPDPDDRRILRVYPTQKAESLFPKVQAVMEEWNRLILEDFTPDEREELIRMMERVREKAVRVAESER